MHLLQIVMLIECPSNHLINLFGTKTDNQRKEMRSSKVSERNVAQKFLKKEFNCLYINVHFYSSDSSSEAHNWMTKKIGQGPGHVL